MQYIFAVNADIDCPHRYPCHKRAGIISLEWSFANEKGMGVAIFWCLNFQFLGGHQVNAAQV